MHCIICIERHIKLCMCVAHQTKVDVVFAIAKRYTSICLEKWLLGFSLYAHTLSPHFICKRVGDKYITCIFHLNACTELLFAILDPCRVARSQFYTSDRWIFRMPSAFSTLALVQCTTKSRMQVIFAKCSTITSTTTTTRT